MSITLSGQEIIASKNASNKVLRLYEKADKFLRKGKVEQAIARLESAVAEDPRFIEGHLKLGGVFYKKQAFKKAAYHFHEAYSLDSTNVKIIQSLALSYEEDRNYKQALVYFLKYREVNKNISPEYNRLIGKKISDYRFRIQALKNKGTFSPEPLPSTINKATFSEYSPSLTADGNKLFFTRVTDNQEDIYYSERDSNGLWSEAILLPNLNTNENEGAHNISADGRTILFTYCSDRPSTAYRGCNIFASFKRKGGWTKPEYFNVINSKAWDSQPNISADGRTIIFASKRPGGKGESDLWVSTRNDNGQWTEPSNLHTINTFLREESPFLHADGKTLYFKSEGHPGFGSFDLFKSVLRKDGSWSEPQNLGHPINTEDHEGSMIVSLDGKTAFYSRGNGMVGFDKIRSDIYTFELPDSLRAHPVGFVKFNIFDAESNEAIMARINVQASDGVTDSYQTDEEGSSLLPLPLGQDYSLNIDKKDYYFYSERFELNTVSTVKSAFEIDVFLRPIVTTHVEKEKPVILKNILFESGSFEFKQESYFELNQLLQLLLDNKEVKIEIRGHTDNVGEEEDNFLLSQNRAKAVYDYLVSKGISKDRLTFIGYGEMKPIVSNSTVEGRKINRRTEFIRKQ